MSKWRVKLRWRFARHVQGTALLATRHAASARAPAPRTATARSGAGARTLAAAIGVDVERLGAALDDFAIDDDLADARQAGQLEHRIEQDRLEDRAQPARPGLAQDRPVRDGLQSLLVELEMDVFHLEQPLILLDESVLRLGQYLDQRLLVEIVERRDDGEAADEFGDQAEFEQIFRFEIAQDLAGLALLGTADLGTKADRGTLATLGNELLQPGEGAAADEQDIGGVDLEEFLLRVLAAALRRDRGDRALHDLQQRLLHALARHVASDRRVVGFAADLVDLVDIDDAALRTLDIVVGGLQQLEDDVLDILADIASLGQRRRMGHGERHVDDARQRLGEQRLARTGRADEQDVRLGELDVVVLGAVGEALVVIMHRDGEDGFGVILADGVIFEHLADAARTGHDSARIAERRLLELSD